MATKHDYHEDHRHGHSNNPRSGKRGGRKRQDSDEQGYDHHHGNQSYRHDGEHRRGNARKLNRGNFEQGHDTRQQDGRRSGGGWRRHDDRFNVEYTDTTQGEPYERQNRPKSGGHRNDHHFNSRGGHRAHQGGGQHGHQGNRDFEESHHGRSHHRGGRGQGGSGLDRKQFKRPFKVIDGESPLNPYHSCSFTIGGNDYISVAQYVIYQKAGVLDFEIGELNHELYILIHTDVCTCLLLCKLKPMTENKR